MDTKRICTICGKPLAPSAPEGLCPECLLKAGLGTGVDIGADTGKTPHFVPPKIEELAPKFPQLEILEFIGQGGMGAVYKARQKQLDRIVALKILPPQAASGPGFAERFTREARALARLNHPHIVTLYEFGQADGLFYFFMEFVDGVNLRQLLNASRIAPKEALAIVPQICEALQFAHDTGIVHRDIKPENILLDKKGQVKIADFGVAKITQGLEQSTAEPTAATSGDLTEAGSSLGTPQYMAPEQIKNSAEVDHRADIYSLGVVFYQMLTGELPSGKIEPPSKKVAIDVRLDEVVLRALEKKPELRFQQVSDVKTLIETIASTPGNSTAPPNEAAQTKSQSQPASPAPPYAYWPGYEYKSKRTWFGLPLLHVANGFDPDTGKVRHARGIVAIGGVATGVVAIGGRAHGIIAFGGLAVGVLAFGGLAAGVISFGGLTIALALAFGGITIAPVAIGGLAIGYFAIGGQGFGVHVLDSSTRNLNDLRQFYSSKLSLLIWAMWTIWAVLLGSSLFISSWARKQTLAARGQTPTETPKTGSRRRYRVLGAIIITLILLFFLRTFVISSYRVKTDSVAPEIPGGSHFLVWKLANHFVPGDLIAYKNGNYVFIGRVIRAENDDLVVNKNGHPNTSISRGLVIGKVISIYWRGEAVQPSVNPVSVIGTAAYLGDIGVYLDALGQVASSNSVTFAIPQEYVQQVAKKFDAGQPMPVGAYNRQGNEFGSGELSGLNNQIDTATGTLTCKASLVPDNANLMIPGLILDIRVLLETKRGVTLVPAKAIFRDSQSAFVWVAKPDQTVNRRTVTTETSNAGVVEIQSGLSAGEIVVVDGADKLQEGCHVNCKMAPNMNGPPFVGQLQQAQVELVAVGNTPWTNAYCWLANGQPSTNQFPTTRADLTVSHVDKKLAFYIRNQSPYGITIPICHLDEQSGILPESASWQPPFHQESNGLFGQLLFCPNNDDVVNLSVGIDNGPWETVLTLSHSPNTFGGMSEVGDWRASYDAVIGSNGDVAVSCVYPTKTNWVSRMVYVTDDARVVPVRDNSFNSSIDPQAGATLLISSKEFARIKEFQVQRRKYQWAEFDNVSLRPGNLTDVEVKDLGTSMQNGSATLQSDASQNTNVQIEPADLREAKAHLAELRHEYGELSPNVQAALARIKELERLTEEEPNDPPDLREAKAHLAELRQEYGELNPDVQAALARIKELERLTEEEPNDPPDLREAKVYLAELRVNYGEYNPEVQKAEARIKELEQNDADTSREICINNLRQIESAKHMWALENNKTNGALPTVDDLKPYLQGSDGRIGEFPVCPDGGTYSINPIGQLPTCSIPGHVLSAQ